MARRQYLAHTESLSDARKRLLQKTMDMIAIQGITGRRKENEELMVYEIVKRGVKHTVQQMVKPVAFDNKGHTKPRKKSASKQRQPVKKLTLKQEMSNKFRKSMTRFLKVDDEEEQKRIDEEEE